MENRKDRSHDEAMAEIFRNNPAYAREFLNSVLKGGGQGELLIALCQIAKACGGTERIAEKAHLNPTQLYRTLILEREPGTRHPDRHTRGHGHAPRRRAHQPRLT